MYEQPNLMLDHQSNTNMFQPLNFFSNQQDSLGQSQLLQVYFFAVIKYFGYLWYMLLCITGWEIVIQEPMIQNTYQESIPINNQMRQVYT